MFHVPKKVSRARNISATAFVHYVGNIVGQ